MTKIRITKEFHFEMAHALWGYDGLCKNIHGHSYKLLVTLIGEPSLDKQSAKLGMVLDYSDLKSIVKTTIIDQLDHALAVNGNSPHKDIDKTNLMFSKVVFLDYQPTCENMLIDFSERLINKLPVGVELHSLMLRETGSSFAEWFAEDNQ
ncbi:MAG: 6-carboxytetrahydropterin synthase [Bacteroidetes bacterium]|nr:6-carboxytetrahydropterin synthase [Bacteroidota bacterium]